jgi:hypothetical protein
MSTLTALALSLLPTVALAVDSVIIAAALVACRRIYAAIPRRGR